MTKPDKKLTCELILSAGSLFLHLDPRNAHVSVPPWLRHQDQLVLQFGRDLAIPIPDLKLTEDGISGTLSFSKSPFPCFVPWSAVFGAAGDDGLGMIWTESMPKVLIDLVAELRKDGKPVVQPAPLVPLAPLARRVKRAPHLSVIDGGKKTPKREGFSFRGGNGGGHDAA